MHEASLICPSCNRIDLSEKFFSAVIPGRAKRESGISRFPHVQLHV
jgi:NMD protein affecting ribosome stability and mRNA decay